MFRSKWLVVVVYLVTHGVAHTTFTDIQEACEENARIKDSTLQMISNDQHLYNVRCELIEEELVPIFGKWRFVME